MKTIFRIAVLFLFLIIVMLSCRDNNKDDEVLFYPNVEVDHFRVKYKGDTIRITQKYKFKKYEYSGDTTLFHGVVEGETTRILVEKDGEYYINQNGYSELFMSNRISYSDSTYRNSMECPCHSIRIRKVKDSLYESTLYANVTENHRNILLVLLYDKSYRIKNIKSGAIYIDCVTDN
jgi:hypothetical protein